MNKKLQVLLVRDSSLDENPELGLLQRAGHVVDLKRVSTAEEMRLALNERAWQIILADSDSAPLGPWAAWTLLQQSGKEIPFLLLLSGEKDEEMAAALMKAGITDYFKKDDLQRLVPVIERELRQVERQPTASQQGAQFFENQSILQSMIDALPMQICVLDEAGTILSVNRAWMQAVEVCPLIPPVYGIGENYLKISELTAGKITETSADFEAGFRSVLLRQEDEFHLEYLCQDRTGKKHWFIAHMSRFQWSGPARVVVARSELTEQKELNHLLRLRLELFDYSTNHTIDEVVLKALEEVEHFTQSSISFYHFVDADQNRVLLQAWSKRTMEEFCTALGKGSHYPIDQAGVWVDAIRQRQPVIHNDYASLPHKKGMPEGHALVVRELVVPILHHDLIVAILGVGNKPDEYTQHDVEIVLYVAGVVWAISELKRVDEVVKENERRYRAVTETAYDAIVTLSADRKIVGWNRAAQQIFGWAATEVIGRPFSQFQFISAYDLLGLEKQLAAIGDGAGNLNRTIEFQGIRKDGNHFALEMSLARWETSHGVFFSAIMRDITERKLTEEFLRLRSAALEAAANAIVITDHRGVIQWGNFAFTDLTGYPLQEAIDLKLNILKSDLYPEETASNLWSTVLSGQVWQSEFYNRRKDGSIYAEEMSVTPLIDPDGFISHFIAIKQNISRRKAAEQELREEKERYRSLYEHLPIGMFRTTPPGEVLMANPAFVQMLGYTDFNDFASMSLENDLYEHAKSRREFKRLVEEAGSVRGFETGLRRKDGCLITVRISAQTIRDSDGKVLYYEGSIEDITEIRQSELQNLRLAAVIEYATEVVILSDLAGKILYINPAFKNIIGVAPEEMIGLDIRSFSSAYLDKKRWEEILQHPRAGKVWRGSIRIEDVRGNLVEFDATISAVFSPRKEISDLVYILRDVTQERMLEGQRRQSQKLEAIGQLAAGIAHEINTPTQYIGNNLRFLQHSYQDLSVLINKFRQAGGKAADGRVSLEALAEALADIQSTAQEIDLDFLSVEIPAAIDGSLNGIERVSTIVNAMKEFSHPGTREKVITNINHAIENTIIVSRNEWKYTAELKTDFAPDLPEVPCLVDEFNQVILNLIKNAADAIREATEKGKMSITGLITIQTYKENDWVVICVGDNGPGIPENIRDRLFDPFFTTKDVGKGTGQGLSISYDVIVNKHAGQIYFESELEKGTRFIIRLPIQLEDAQSSFDEGVSAGNLQE